MQSPLTIWCNAVFPEPARTLLVEGVAPHRLIFSSQLSASNLTAGAPDPALGEADVAFGQPEPSTTMQAERLRWTHLTSAGYTRYDTDEFRTALRSRGARLTNSSSVYAEPCAQHALAFMLAHARQLAPAVQEQCSTRAWPAEALRAKSHLLTHQRVLLLGYGAIARRLTELLAPFHVEVQALRRKSAGDEVAKIIAPEDLDASLASADHVVNILPDNPETRLFFGAQRFQRMKPGAAFYNIGRGTTVDQPALIASLERGHLAGAYLDVTDPEPLPPEHPLWSAPGCYITPHTAGGFGEEFEALVRHFLENLRRFTAGEELCDGVM